MPDKYRVHTRQHDCWSFHSLKPLGLRLQYLSARPREERLSDDQSRWNLRAEFPKPTGFSVIVTIRVGTPEPTSTDRIAQLTSRGKDQTHLNNAWWKGGSSGKEGAGGRPMRARPPESSFASHVVLWVRRATHSQRGS